VSQTVLFTTWIFTRGSFFSREFCVFKKIALICQDAPVEAVGRFEYEILVEPKAGPIFHESIMCVKDNSKYISVLPVM
jgi:hypothetical protein